MMCCWAGFNAHQAGRQIGEELKDLAAADTLADHHSAITIHAVDLKHGLRNIQADRDNFAHGRLSSSGSLRCNHPMAPRCRRVGAVHSINRVADLVSAFKLKRSCLRSKACPAARWSPPTD